MERAKTVSVGIGLHERVSQLGKPRGLWQSCLEADCISDYFLRQVSRCGSVVLESLSCLVDP